MQLAAEIKRPLEDTHLQQFGERNRSSALIGSAPGARALAAAPSAFLDVPVGTYARQKTIGICNKPAAPLAEHAHTRRP